jgi:hypothetical protein
MRVMRSILLVVSLVCGLSATTQSSTATSSDTSKVEVVAQQSVKKQVFVPRPKTNWSKLKELFM